MIEIYITCLLQILSFSSCFRRFEIKNFFVSQPLYQTIFHNWSAPPHIIFFISTTLYKTDKKKQLISSWR